MAVFRVKWMTGSEELRVQLFFYICNIFQSLLFCVQSEDSMEHLSAEERACLMYLEETIEALEVQEDSGLSNDEPDPGLQAEEMGRAKVNGTFI